MTKVDISKEILKVLRKSKHPLTTCKIATMIGIAWSTAFIHCIRLKTEGKINGTLVDDYKCNGEGRLWSYRR